MKLTGIFFVFSLFFLTSALGQKFLIIERSGTPRTKKFSSFDDLTFKLKYDNKGWYTRQILDMNPNGQMILLGDTWIPLSDISNVRLSHQRKVANILAGALQSGGASMILGDAWYTIRGQSRFTQGGMEFGLLNIAVGTAIRALWGPIQYKLGKKTRLKVIDLTFGTTKL
jgi:hypothetical protein